MSRLTLRLAAVALAALPAVLATSSPAVAAPGDSFSSRTSGFVATTQWVQYQVFPNAAFGNVHVGQLYAFETTRGQASVFSFIDDYQCPDGVYPQTDGHSGQPVGGCTAVGSRVLEGDVAMTRDRKGTSAVIRGSLTASTGGDPHTGAGGAALGQVPADFTLTGTGSPVRSSSTFRYREGGVSFSDTYRAIRTSATVTGVLGPMRFEEAYQRTGSLETFTSSNRSRG